MAEKKDGIGLALSGGGYRATLFHLGGLWRLNELGMLPKLKEITSVSGGSIVSAYLGLNWKDLHFVKGTADNFEEVIVAPVRKFCARTIDANSIILGMLSPFHYPWQLLAGKYRKHLYGDATLQDLPHFGKGPLFTIYGTSLQTGVSVRFSQPYLAEYHIGMNYKPDLDLGTAVAASSGFPPFFCPVKLNFSPSKWKKTEGADLYNKTKLRELMMLVDGGVYDNIGIERIWKRFNVVLVSDAGAPFVTKEDSLFIRISLLARILRVLSISHGQVLKLRKRMLIEGFEDKKYKGTYWGIASHPADYKLEKNKLPKPILSDSPKTRALSLIRTRLNRFSDDEQRSLINWGYALADTAMRRHILPKTAFPGKLPYKM